MFVGFILAGAFFFFFFFRGASAQPRPATPPPARAAAPGVYLPVSYRINLGVRLYGDPTAQYEYPNAVSPDPSIYPAPVTSQNVAPPPNVYDGPPKYVYYTPAAYAPVRLDDPSPTYSDPSYVYNNPGYTYPGMQPIV